MVFESDSDSIQLGSDQNKPSAVGPQSSPVIAVAVGPHDRIEGFVQLTENERKILANSDHELFFFGGASVALRRRVTDNEGGCFVVSYHSLEGDDGLLLAEPRLKPFAQVKP
jgi:hypothetical protein